MSQHTILITGASSGLGLAFLRHYVSKPSTQKIIALDTTSLPSSIPRSQYTTIDFHTMDITSPDLQKVAAQYTNQPINLIVHCAGIRGLVPSVLREQKSRYEPGDVAAAETFHVIDKTTMMKTFEVNTFGTFTLLQTFLPNLLLAATTHSSPKVVIMSSRMGSVSSNTSVGGYAYRASKAALNAVVKSFSIDVPEVTFLLLHPGRVETGLVEWKEEGAITVEESLGDCLKVIEGARGGDSGRLVDRFGAEIAW